MRKKLDTRFPAARIKKIMQADEDVGKIANAVPVLVSKALELFLQDLCGRTYDVTVQRGAKTVNSLHLKHCVHSYNVYDFLKEVVSKVPDYGNSDAAVDAPKRRKVVAHDSVDSDEDSKKSIVNQEMGHASSSNGRGRGRGRTRGRGRGRATEREHLPPPSAPRHDEIEPSRCQQSITQISCPIDNNNTNNENNNNNNNNNNINNNNNNSLAPNENPVKVSDGTALDEMVSSAGSAAASAGPSHVKDEECSEMDRMAVDPLHLAQLSSRLDEEEEEEDYDEEG